MILFFKANSSTYYAVSVTHRISPCDIKKLSWLFNNASPIPTQSVSGRFIAPRREIVSPWSTNAVEITRTMGISGINRIEECTIISDAQDTHDAMLQQVYEGLDQQLFNCVRQPDPVLHIDNIAQYNEKKGLALSEAEIKYLNNLSTTLGRKLTDSEVFGFSQINSEHCRHKLFHGTFILDGQEKTETLFQLIKKTARENPLYIVSAYEDNVAFIQGPEIEQFAPLTSDKPDYFKTKNIKTVISLKAETHNFPTTVEPFNGAATGTGGEIRDRMAGGKGSIPLGGTVVYMTAYPRIDGGRPWEKKWDARPWKYQSPKEILIKASDGASDFGNKFGQPLICGSLVTFEHVEDGTQWGFDKTIMLAGGIGFGAQKDSQKDTLNKGNKIAMMGGDNYRIGIGGGAVSSVDGGELENALEWNAIQRANPEMQKRVMNVVRALTEMADNPILSIHDHGAGGHLNCFAELLKNTGGILEIDPLPLGDTSLSDKEILSNESQERMGLALEKEGIPFVQRIADRERAPLYIVGTATKDKILRFIHFEKKTEPINLHTDSLFGALPKTILRDKTKNTSFASLHYNPSNWLSYLDPVLQLESVACKDWLTNKVDRSVTGKVASQQTCGALQLPLNNVGVMALDFLSNKGIATSIGHAPSTALVDSVAGSRLAIAEALTNILWAPLTHGLKGVSLSANWMWPTKVQGEGVRLYKAVAAASEFACRLGINIPTGKDSLSMTQKYTHNKAVHAPGTVVISAVAEVEDIRRTVSPPLVDVPGSKLFYIRFSNDPFQLGGSGFGQTINQIGSAVPNITDAAYFIRAFNTVQHLIKKGMVLAGHDIASGGLITTLLEMCFPSPGMGLNITVSDMGYDPVKILFSENPGVVIQTQNEEDVTRLLDKNEIQFNLLGTTTENRILRIKSASGTKSLAIDTYRETWYKTSFLFDQLQRPKAYAEKRKEQYVKQPLSYSFPPSYNGRLASYGINPEKRKPSGIKAAVIREKGTNGDREMAYAMYLAGFDVKDVHMTDLISGRETLSDISMIVFAGGFSNSDVLRSAKGWAGAFLYNTKAKDALTNFYAAENTLSLGVCNGCQLMMELELICPDHKDHPKTHQNGSGKFESLFANVVIPPSRSIMLQPLAGTRLGVWVAHGEGRFRLPAHFDHNRIAATYAYSEYPGNPNDSDLNAAAITSADGRHLAIMPHIERSLFPWNWGYYPHNRKQDQITPWIESLTKAFEWIKSKA